MTRSKRKGARARLSVSRGGSRYLGSVSISPPNFVAAEMLQWQGACLCHFKVGSASERGERVAHLHVHR